MTDQSHINYNRIAAAIEYLSVHYKQQPSLDEVAEKIHVSPFHFHRMFTEWAGVSPKKFLQYISLQHAKKMLANQNATLVEAAENAGLSGTARLHDLFVSIEAMTPGAYKKGAWQLQINYSFATTPFGKILIGSTDKGICYMAFSDNEVLALNLLKEYFPYAVFIHQTDSMQSHALAVFTGHENQDPVKLHLKGTGFQLKVWEALLKIPSGNLTTYGNLANKINQPKAARAVGSAIGSNPVAFLIPCHRVIQASGILGGYMWGVHRKAAIIGWEAAKSDAANSPI